MRIHDSQFKAYFATNFQKIITTVKRMNKFAIHLIGLLSTKCYFLSL